MDQRKKLLDEALNVAGMKIQYLNPEKTRPVYLTSGKSITSDRLSKDLAPVISSNFDKFKNIIDIVLSPLNLQDFLMENYKTIEDIRDQKKKEILGDAENGLGELTLNLDASSKDLNAFFLSTDEEIISEVSALAYLRKLKINNEEAYEQARLVFPEYRPRSPAGISEEKDIAGVHKPVFNTYRKPDWERYKGKLPDEIPELIEKLIDHLFPLEEEKEYVLHWMAESITGRVPVYLVMCGNPGTGKNRFKILLRALHGHDNTVDGKKSTFSEKFNSQFADSTLMVADELKYDVDMENTMKEVQNDSISIERKGVDATRSTKIHCSIVIMNNKPRDNHIALDARKFCPVVINPKRLETTMTREEIGELTDKVEDPTRSTYDVAFIAQFGRWLKRHGRKEHFKKNNHEYKGPAFYKLAHTSMSRWQKKAVSVILSINPNQSSRIVHDPEKGFLWSSISEWAQRKNTDRSLMFPEYSTVHHFFDIFVDSDGKQVFKTLGVKDDIENDFYVKIINSKAKIMNEAQVVSAMEKEAEKGIRKAKAKFVEREEDEEEDYDQYEL